MPKARIIGLLILALGGMAFAYRWYPAEIDRVQIISFHQTLDNSLDNPVRNDVDTHLPFQKASNRKAEKADWLNEQLKDRLDSYIVSYQDDEKKMWQEFQHQCHMFADCQGLTALLMRYIDYKKALINIDGPSPNDINAFAKRMDELQGVREQFFTSREYQLLFSHEVEWDKAALHRLHIKMDPTLDLSQRSALLEAHIAGLPESVKSAFEPSLQLQKLARLRHQRVHIDEKDEGSQSYNTFAAQFGEPAAERLITLKKQRNQWQKRVLEYELKRASLKRQYSDERLRKEIQILRSQSFTSNEIKRIKVISLTRPIPLATRTD